MNPISSSQLPSLDALAQAGTKSQVPGQDGQEGSQFADILKQALQEVNAAQDASTQEARNLISGNSTDMHTAILAVQKADVSFQMMMAVRSKLVSAYQEVMRMQM
ncbi:flagellar hook-basal body complex protein FliE [Mesoterricola sediminis]|uniref:Flagellar hook-basal body complex protein FliE n=1 Tax=Mesoterricola sediminis TaxID=2927980 RepID=A0AA48KGJ3_9BACT|nr:flagellar hook-basal body complex protein FliE [Mesoterricola sediminis]BDU77483.1 flagellar hook-basal body complex protein FliE [Mesoterricola sediminis]